MPLPPLNPDDLGHLAEEEFRTLCARGQLVCNKSERDRTGWDFLVEFPMDASRSGASLDHRQPVSCHVQLKATQGSTGRVGLRLSSAERLAKDPRPSVLVVFRMDGEGALAGGYIIHLIDRALAKILKRLRQAEANGRGDVNHMTISFEYARFGERFEATAEGLRNALLDACGDDPASYITEKQRQLRELGYEGGRFEIDAVLMEEEPGQLVDVFLGLRSARPSELTTYDSRFGIRLPVEVMGEGDEVELTFEPTAVDTCVVQVRGPGSGPPAVFPTELVVPPPALARSEHLKVLMRHPDLHLTFAPGHLNIMSARAMEGVERSLGAWQTLLRALIYLASGEARVAFTQWSRLDAPMEFEVRAPLDGPYIDQLPQYLRLVDNVRHLLQSAGLEADVKMTFEQLGEASYPVSLATDLLFNASPTASFAFESDADEDRLDLLYANHLMIADIQLAYTARFTFERLRPGQPTFSTTSIAALDVRPLSVAEMDGYVGAQSDRHDLHTVLRHEEVAMETLPSPS